MSGDPAFDNIRLELTEAVATLVLDRPKALNALDAATLRELGVAADLLARSADVRALVITGAGKAFSAGADIAAMADMAPGDGFGYARLGHDTMARIEALEMPVVAAVNGVALGGGLELALACDLIIASDRARLGQPEINLGLVPGFGGTQRLARRIGQARARELIYLGHALNAEEALRAGLVERVVPGDGLAAAAAELAADLAAKAPVAMRQAKRATAIAADAVLAAGCRFEAEAFAVTFASDDRVEGLRAFLEKRHPTWKGR